MHAHDRNARQKQTPRRTVPYSPKAATPLRRFHIASPVIWVNPTRSQGSRAFRNSTLSVFVGRVIRALITNTFTFSLYRYVAQFLDARLSSVFGRRRFSSLSLVRRRCRTAARQKKKPKISAQSISTIFSYIIIERLEKTKIIAIRSKRNIGLHEISNSM